MTRYSAFSLIKAEWSVNPVLDLVMVLNLMVLFMYTYYINNEIDSSE
jgi:hypothetical protein